MSKNTPQRQRRRERRASLRDDLIIWPLALTIVALVWHFHLPMKWVTAFGSIMVTFFAVIATNPRRLKSFHFWAVVVAALIIDLPLIWLLFRYTLRAWDNVPWIAVYPLSFVAVILIAKLLNFTTPHQSSALGGNAH